MSENTAIIKTGDDLRQWRTLNGLTQDVLALAFETTRQTIARLEFRGDQPIAREWMYALSFLKRFPEEIGNNATQKIWGKKPV